MYLKKRGTWSLSNNPAALYSIENNSWENLRDTEIIRGGSTLFNLNGRYFILGGHKQSSNTCTRYVEEYDIDNQEMKPNHISTPRCFSSVLPLPATLFANTQSKCRGID
jgi:hypothetical protein